MEFHRNFFYKKKRIPANSAIWIWEFFIISIYSGHVLAPNDREAMPVSGISTYPNEYTAIHGAWYRWNIEVQLMFIFRISLIVLDHEVIRINSRSRTRRSTDERVARTIHLTAFGQKMILNLSPNKNLIKNVPMYFLDANMTSKPNVVPIKEVR